MLKMFCGMMTSTLSCNKPCFNLLQTTRHILRNEARCFTGLGTKLPQALTSQNVTYCQRRNMSNKGLRGNLGISFPDRKMGRADELEYIPPDRTVLERVSDGLEIFKKGIEDYKEECESKFYFDQDILLQHNDYQYFAQFDEDTIGNWSCTADSDVGEGRSKASLTTSTSGKALFSGFLNTEVPKDGVLKRTGFCNISSPLNTKSFERQIPYDWMGFTDILLRVRGDGRNYMLLLQTDRHYSVFFHDMYNYPIYTRGGPYWQYVKIPFSSFFLAAGGRIQDSQEPLNLDCIRDVGITVGDGTQGRFQLEIDYIALINDQNTTDHDFEYELYKKHPYTV